MIKVFILAKFRVQGLRQHQTVVVFDIVADFNLNFRQTMYVLQPLLFSCENAFLFLAMDLLRSIYLTVRCLFYRIYL